MNEGRSREEKQKNMHGGYKLPPATLASVLGFLFLFVSLVSQCGRKERKVEVPTFEVDQNTILIYGIVRDMLGEPVEGAKVKIIGIGGEVMTDAEGLYKLKIVFESLPSDGVITIRVEKDGFVPAYSMTSFARILAFVNQPPAVQDRVRRVDFVLLPPISIRVHVIDRDGNAVPGSLVGVLPGPNVATYLGVPQNQFVASVTTGGEPVTITSSVPHVIGDMLQFVAIPPEDLRDTFDISVTSATISDGMLDVRVVLMKQPLQVLWSSVQSGQFLVPDGDIKVIFSKSVTSVMATLICRVNNQNNQIQLFVDIEGATAMLKPAGRVLGNCTLQITQAYGTDGEVLGNTVGYSFVAFDPAAPRGLACPQPEIDLAAYSSTATGYRFDMNLDTNRVRVFSPNISQFSGYSEMGSNNLNLVWSAPAVYGISGFRIYSVSKQSIVQGNPMWTQIGNGTFRISTGRWYANIPVGAFDLSYGGGISIAVVPVNINGEEVCSLDNAPVISVEDNLGPSISAIANFRRTDYRERVEDNVTITLSENITSASVEIMSRVFEVEKLSEFVQGNNQVALSFYLNPISVQIPPDSENSDADRALLISKEDASRIWVGETVNIRNREGRQINNASVTSVITVGNNVEVWFDRPVDIAGTDPQLFIGGFIVPDAGNNNLQVYRQNNNVQVRGNLIVNVGLQGIAVGDTLQILDADGDVITATVVSAGNLDGDIFIDDIQVDADLSGLRCQEGTAFQCSVRTLTPDLWFKVSAWDTSGNMIRSDMDTVSSDGNVIW